MLEIVKTKGEVEYKIYNYLNSLFLKRIKPNVLIAIITAQMEESYDKGKEMKADEIRRALRIFI